MHFNIFLFYLLCLNILFQDKLLLTINCRFPPHMETSQLVCRETQLTVFCMCKITVVINELKEF